MSTSQLRGTDRGGVVLFCLPCAGGDASMYRPWGADAPDPLHVVPLQLPGRGILIGESLLTDLQGALEYLGGQVARQRQGRPYAIFGHSLGAGLAFWLTSRLAASHPPPPLHLFLSAFSPDHESRQVLWPNEMSRNELRKIVCELGGTPRELLEDDEYVDSILLPQLEADLAILADLRQREWPMLNVPTTVLAGESDRSVPLQELPSWAAHTRRDCRVVTYPGSHFYLLDERQAILREIASTLEIEAARGKVRENRMAEIQSPEEWTERLVTIFSEVLDCPASANVDFYEQGGNSISAGKIVSRARSEAELPLTMRDVFAARTPKAIVESVLARKGAF